MTQEQALRKARKCAKKWGGFKHNAVAYTKTTRPCFIVGMIGNIRGEGNSWEAAFANADTKLITVSF